MEFSEIIGAIGVSLCLIAFLFSVFGYLSQESKLYALLNLFGGGLSCYAAILIDFLPFVILEGTWAIVALVALFKKRTTK
jgi:hypothetical protein